MTSARRRRALLLVPLAGLALAFSGPLSGQRLYARDLMHYEYPVQRVEKLALERGELPLWNPYVNAGVPLAGQGDGRLYPPSMLLLSVADAPAALPWFLLLHHAVALLGTYAWLRALGRSRGAAAIGAAAYALSGTLVANHIAARLLVGAAWMPVAFAGLERALQGDRPRIAEGVAVAGLALALMVLGGGIETAYLTGLGLGLRVAVAEARRTRVAGAAAGLLASVALVGIGGGALTLVPLLETTAASTRAGGAGDEVGSRALAPGRLVTVVAPGALGEVYPDDDLARAVREDDGSRPWHPTVYAGAAVVGLAALGLGRAARRAPHLLALGALALVLSLGDRTPLGPLVRGLLPGIGMFRTAEKWFVGVALVLPALAAFGADALRARDFPARRRAWFGGAAGGLVVGLLAVVVREAYGLDAMAPSAMARLGLAAATLPACAWVFAFVAPRRALAVVLALVVLDLSVNAQRHLYTLPGGMDVPVPWAASTIAARLEGPHEARIVRMPLSGPTHRPIGADDGAATEALHWCETLASNACVPWCENACGFLTGTSRRYLALWEQARTQSGPGPLLDLLGVRFAVVQHAPGAGLPRGRTPQGVVVADDLESGIAIVERPTWRARARLFERVVVCPDDASALSLMPGSTPGPDTLAVVASHLPHGPLALDGEPAADRPCRVLEHGLGHLTVEVESARGGGLLVAESWAPGWTATIDGAPAEVLPAWSALRAVLVPPGRHLVAMSYRPASFRIGLALSAGTLLLVAAGVALARRRAAS